MIVPTGSALRATSTFGPSGTAGAAAACWRAGAGEHVLGHDRGDRRDDQRSDQQHNFLHIHGAIASPTGPRLMTSLFRQIG